MSSSPSHLCEVCKQAADKRCGGCQKVFYCSQDHQAMDWKQHKAACRPQKKPQQQPKQAALANLMANSRFNIDNPASSVIDHFAGKSKKDTYVWLIDAFRLRVEDDYVFRGEPSGLYGGDSPLPDFKNFLQLAAKRKVLPSWWNPKIDVPAIIKTAMSDSWASINHAVEKSDIQEHYDPSAPMTLRMLADQIYADDAEDQDDGIIMTEEMRRLGIFTTRH